MKKRWIPILTASVILLSAVAVLPSLLGKRNKPPSLYEPLEIKSDFCVSYGEIDSVDTIDTGEWPLLRFDSYQQVLDFEEEYNAKEPVYGGGAKPISDTYDAAFFETKTLIVIQGYNTADEIVRLGDVSYDGKNFSIEIRFHKENPNFMYIDELECWGYAIVMDKQVMANDTVFYAQKTTVPYSFWNWVKLGLSRRER